MCCWALRPIPSGSSGYRISSTVNASGGFGNGGRCGSVTELLKTESETKTDTRPYRHRVTVVERKSETGLSSAWFAYDTAGYPSEMAIN